MHVSPVYLTSDQIDKLRRVLTPTIPIYPSPPTSSFPTLHIIPKDFLRQVLFKLKQHEIKISSVRLYGGAASYVLIDDSDFVYRDIDILFDINTPLSSEKQTTLFSSNNEPYLCDVWTIIKYIISSCLIEFIPNTSACTQYFISSVLDTYTKKNIKITSEQDSWALLSLQNLLGQNLELKFVENLKRQWQFSVDSFQINLKPFLLENRPESKTTNIQTKSLVVDAINSVTILKKDNNDNQQNQSSSPLQFGFFTPSILPNNEEGNNIQYKTLATITTIQASKNNNVTFESRSNESELTNDDEHADSPLQFQLSINEEVDDGIEADLSNDDDDQPTSISKIEVYSVYKDLREALYHLNHKLIATYEPETMRGGGLLKYCDLLARNYKLYDNGIMTHMQRYMCSRFCIDYKTIPEQLHVIAQYVATHYLPSSDMNNFLQTSNTNELFQRNFIPANQLVDSNYDSKQIDQIDLINARLCLLFFEHLWGVIQQSTVCLTHEDRELLLMNLHYLKEYYHCKYEYLFSGDSQHYQKYHQPYIHPQRCTNSSSNSSRSTSPSNQSSKSYGYNRGNSHRNHYSQRQSQHGYHRQRPHTNQSVVQCRNQS